MNRYAVFGGGMMGRAIVKNLIDTPAEVDLFDWSENLLRETAGFVGSDRLRTERVDATNPEAVKRALAGHDVAVGALPHGLSLGLVQAAIAAGTSLVDLVGEAPEKRRALDGEARSAGVTIVPGCGVAPGISNFCVGRGMELLDETQNAVIYVGGIPREPKPPLFYETVFLLESVLAAYRRPATILRGGEAVEVEALSGVETVDFPEPVGRLEAFFTDGLGSLPLTVGERVTGNLYEKTLRTPGHRDAVKLLEACGLLETTPVEASGVSVPPVAVVQKVLERKLALGPSGDILVMRVLIEGTEAGRPRVHELELVDFFDRASGHTAMARTTGFTAAAAARMIARGTILDRGVLFPEEVFLGERFDTIVGELASEGVHVIHRERENPQRSE